MPHRARVLATCDMALNDVTNGGECAAAGPSTPRFTGRTKAGGRHTERQQAGNSAGASPSREVNHWAALAAGIGHIAPGGPAVGAPAGRQVTGPSLWLPCLTRLPPRPDPRQARQPCGLDARRALSVPGGRGALWAGPLGGHIPDTTDSHAGTSGACHPPPQSTGTQTVWRAAVLWAALPNGTLLVGSTAPPRAVGRACCLLYWTAKRPPPDAPGRLSLLLAGQPRAEVLPEDGAPPERRVRRTGASGVARKAGASEKWAPRLRRPPSRPVQPV